MIYLFDKDENLIKIVRKTAVKTALQTYSLTTEKYVSDRLTIEMRALPDDELEQVEYMAIQAVDDTHNFHFFYVAQKHSEGKLTELIGVQSGIEELRKTAVYDKRPKNAFAREVISDLLLDTNWSARFVGETLPRSTNFYYTSVFDALKKVCKVWDLEMQFFVQMNGNQIGARVIDFKKKIGAAVGKRVVYGHNALKIVQEVERTNIYTALVGRGKGEQVSTADTSETAIGGSRQQQADGYGRKITFEDVVWRISDGKPVNKPKGQKYVELPEMTAHFGIKQADGSMRPKIGFVEFSEEEDKEVVLQKTYEALVDTSRPQVTFKTSTVYLKGAAIGDTIRVVRHDKRIDYDTRIFELTINRLNDQSSDVKLGDRITEGQASRIQTIADQAVDNFIQNEFSNFVQNLPDFLPSADGFNTNWYGAEDPTVKYKGKVVINDIWYKPDPEHEGHKIMYRWTGEAWEELVRTADNDRVKRLVEEVQAKANELTQQAQAADQKASEALTRAGASSDLAKLAKETADRAVASSAQTGQDLLTKSREIQEAVRLTREKLSSQADQIRRQAQAQEGLFSRLMTVEETANGTKATLTELSKTVNSTTGNLTSVTQRVASVETGLSGVREQYSQLNQAVSSQTGQITAVTRQTAELQRGLDGVTERFENLSVGGVNLVKRTGEPFVMGYGITNTTWNDSEQKAVLDLTNPANRRDLHGEILPQSSALNNFKPQKGVTYTQSIRVDTDATFIPDGPLKFTWYTLSPPAHNFTSASIKKIGENSYLLWSTRTWHTENNPLRAFDIINLHQVLDFKNSGTYLKFYKPKLELGTIPTDWSPAEEDFRHEFAEYKRTATENSAELGRRVQSLDGSLSETKTLAQQTAESISQLATKTEVSAVTGRLETAESTITQQADQISQRLTRAEVDSLVNAKGYLENTVFDNYKRETAQTIEHQLTETRGMIPKNFGGVNLLKNTETMTGTGWSSSGQVWRKSQETYRKQPMFEWVSGGKYTPIAYYSVTPGATYTFSTYVKKGSQGRIFLYLYDDNKFLNVNRDQIFQLEADKFSLISVTFTAERVGTLAIRLAMITDEQGGFSHTPFMLEHSTIPTDWSPALEDLVSQVDFNRVKETAQLYERVLGRTEGDVTTNLVRQVMTSQLFQTEVKNPLSNSVTRMTQLADSWAVKHLTNSGTVLSQLNLNSGGVKIQGKLIHLNGQTLIDNGVIKAAHIQSLNADKVTTGTLNAANVNIINLNANKLVGLDANFIKAKIESALVEWLKGKIITAQNDAMRINLNQANITFNQNATIDFNSSNNALVRRKGMHTAFVHFNDVSSSADNGVGSVYASIGVTSSGDGINSASSGRFCGARFFRGARGTAHAATVDQAEIYGDSILFKDDFSLGRGFKFQPTTIDKMVDMNYLVGAVRALARCWLHWNNIGWDPNNNDMRRAVIAEYNAHMKDL